MIIKNDIVIVIFKVDLDDFEGFFSKYGEILVILWELMYEEISVVNGKIGMLKCSDFFLLGFFFFGEDFIWEWCIMLFYGWGVVVNFRSVVKLLDESYGYVEWWKIVVKNEKDISYFLNFDSLE